MFYCNRQCNLDGDWCAEGPGCPNEINAEAAKHLLELAQAEKDGRLVVLPPNDPLTLEELREMDGEPVWVEALDYGVSRWAFVAADCEVVRYFTTRSNVACDVIARQFKTYGKTWLAYRRKPEEGTTA